MLHFCEHNGFITGYCISNFQIDWNLSVARTIHKYSMMLHSAGNVVSCLRAVSQLLLPQNVPLLHVDLGLPQVVENPMTGEQLFVAGVYFFACTCMLCR